MEEETLMFGLLAGIGILLMGLGIFVLLCTIAYGMYKDLIKGK